MPEELNVQRIEEVIGSMEKAQGKLLVKSLVSALGLGVFVGLLCKYSSEIGEAECALRFMDDLKSRIKN